MKKILIVLQLLYFSLFTFAVSQFSINPISLTEQLPSNSVQRVYQDSEGFMWFGTLDGLCRYDGYQLLTFRSDVKNPNLLTNNEITCICEDTRNFIWIGTKKGLNILDKKDYRIKHLDIPEVNNVEIKTIAISSDSSIWIGTYRQLIRLNPDHTIRKKYDSSIPITSVNAIYEDNEGNIWAALWGHGLFRYDKEKDTFSRLPPIGATNNPFKLFQDKDNNMWVCTWGDGIFLLNSDKNGAYSYTNSHVEAFTSPVNEARYFSITQDDMYGYLWIISISGLYTFKINEDKSLQKIDISPLLKETNNIFSEIVKDKKGNLWIGTFSEGVFRINFDKPVILNYSMRSIKEKTGITPNITTMYEDDNGNIWFNQNRYGLGILSTKTNRVTLHRDIPQIKDLVGIRMTNCIAGFRSLPNEVWVAPSDYPIIYSMKEADGKILLNHTIDLEKIHPQAGNARMFFEDRKNNIWIITSSRIFIKPYNKNEIEHVELPISSVTGIAEDSKGCIWISTSANGVYQIYIQGNQINNTQITHYTKENYDLPSNNIEAICGDVNGNVWLGTKEGNILLYEILKENFFDLSNSFKTINEGILNIIADEYGHIWVSTNKRVTEFNPVNNAFREYSISDGVLVNSFLKNSFYESKSGKIFLGGNNGISAFTSSPKLSEKPKDIKVYVTDVKIENKSVLSNGVNNRFDILSQAIRFEPDDKNIEISFSSLDYTFPEKIQYAYKLNGIDNDWVYTENNRQFAIYNRLKKGDHTFLLKATDENGLWSSNITQLKIYKRPAFYETWWAYTIYFILLITAIYITVRIVKNRIRLRNELKIAQIEKEKSEELTQSKLRYFTNISHDFMTPLTIISCLIDDAEIAYKGKITQFDSMRSNVQRLRRLLQQVLDFRKVESGNMKLKLSYGDIVTFVRDICSTHFEPLMQQKNISFSFLTNQNQIQAYFDPDKIDKVVFNLLSNAYKYTPENGKIQVELELLDENWLTIRVGDTGIGISKKEQKNIFTRFYTDKEGRTKDSNGIGLSLTKDLIELHRGTIGVESEINEGTTFIIKIPVQKDYYSILDIENSNRLNIIEKQMEYALQDEVEKTSLEEIQEESEKEDVNLLLVEDNEELLKVVSNILSKHYNVFRAINGLEALDIIKENNIDIVISDVMMPEMDGLELARALKKDLETSHIPILLLTAKNSTEDRIECYNAGADGYISKPFEMKVLEARINNFISHKKDRQKEFKSNVEINISTLEYPSFDEQFLNNAIKIIEEDLSKSDLDVNAFAEKLNMSKSSLYRKMKIMTGLSPNEFIRNIRLKHACQMLKNQFVSISEVAYAIGFSDPKYFTLCFKNEFNLTPREYQKSIFSEEEQGKD